MKLFCLVLGMLVAPSMAAESLVPAAEFGFSFGGARHRSDAFVELRVSDFVGPARLDVMTTRITRQSGPASFFLGVPLGQQQFRSAAEEEAAATTNWLWWGLGTAAVAGAVVLSKDDDKDSSAPPDEGCTTVGGTTVIPPSDDFGVDPSCM